MNPPTPAATLVVHVRGLLAWLRNALRERSWGARAYYDRRRDRMVIFRPFLTSAYHGVKAGADGRRISAMSDFLRALREGGQDDSDLFFHEVWWHRLKGFDHHDARGIGSGDALTRARTTGAEQRQVAAADVLGFYAHVELVGKL